MMKYPYFQHSKLQRFERDLIQWFEHFKKNGVACAIVKGDQPSDRSPRFSLWREGKEMIDFAPNSKQLCGEIVLKFDPEGIFIGTEPDYIGDALSQSLDS